MFRRVVTDSNATINPFKVISESIRKLTQYTKNHHIVKDLKNVGVKGNKTLFQEDDAALNAADTSIISLEEQRKSKPENEWHTLKETHEHGTIEFFGLNKKANNKPLYNFTPKEPISVSHINKNNQRDITKGKFFTFGADDKNTPSQGISHLHSWKGSGWDGHKWE